VRFYVDESAAGLGLALTAARKDTIHVGHRLIPECKRGALDTEWIPAVAARGLIVIARDKKLRTKPVEIQTLWAAGLRVFNIGGKRDQSTWEWLARVVKCWPRMEEVIESRGAGPWIYMINENGLDEYRPGEERRPETGRPRTPRPKKRTAAAQGRLFELDRSEAPSPPHRT
jgi:hypothetical protein